MSGIPRRVLEMCWGRPDPSLKETTINSREWGKMEGPSHAAWPQHERRRSEQGSLA